MFDVALADKIEDELSAALYLEMFVLQSRDAVCAVMRSALFGPDADVKRVDQPHHDSEHFLFRKSAERNIVIRDLSKLREVLSEFLDLCELLSLLLLGKLGMVEILDAARRIHADRLNTAALRRRDPNMTPCRRHYQSFDPFERSLVGDLLSRVVRVEKA